MTIALSHPIVGAVVAVDRRHTLTLDRSYYAHTEGERYYADRGGKLQRFGSAWVAVVGDSFYGALAFSAFQSVDCRDPIAVSRALSRLALTAEDSTAVRWGTAVELGLKDSTNFVITSLGSISVIRWDGKIISSGVGQFAAAYPAHPERAAQHAREKETLRLRVYSMDDRWNVVRAIAHEFANVYSESDLISPTVEIGVGDYYLCGWAQDLVKATNGDLDALLSEPASAPCPDILDAYSSGSTAWIPMSYSAEHRTFLTTGKNLRNNPLFQTTRGMTDHVKPNSREDAKAG